MKTIIITGCADGIGKQLFTYYQQHEEYKVYGVDKKHINMVDVFNVDVSDYEQLKYKLACIEHIPVDVVINCAGVCIRKPFQTYTNGDIDYMVDGNLKTMLNMIRLFLPNLTITKGCIINIGSIHSYSSLVNYSIYSMTKAGMEGFTHSLAVELAGRDIRCNVIGLGPVRTGMLPFDKEQVGRIPLGRLVDIKDIIGLVDMLILNRSITGSSITLDCGITSKLSVEM